MNSPLRLGAGLAGLGLSLSVLTVVGAAPAQAADPVTINLLNINDFHGRIDANTTRFATTIEQLRADGGEDNTLFLSAGDNVGASVFASNVAQDQPTIDVLNALELDTSAVGNHEFDKGFDDLTDRIEPASDWDHLGANVYEAGTQTPAMQEFETFEVAGVTVGVVGAVTQETPTLVAGEAVEALEFGDPVEATNRVAAMLSDGDEGNGEADVIVAEFHEGAGAGTPDGATLEDEVAAGLAFADIVEDTSAEVDAIFTGHTHKQYAWDAPIPGEEGTRPIVQTGSYGENIGQIELSVDPETGEVVAYSAENVARAAEADVEGFPRVAAVDEIVQAALDYAAEIGNEPIAEITDDITTAFSGGDYGADGYAGGSRDDRSRESTMGGLAANALYAAADAIGDGADMGLTNPGGLRAEFLYAGDTSTNPENTDGVVTYAEANAVMTFGNTVAVSSLTGAQLISVLEQQWQPEGGSRPYQQLGLSDNVSVIADPTAPAGSRIVSVRIDGEEIDPAGTYRVGTLNFLAQGNDNFTAFSEGSYVDTGVLDVEAFRDYLDANSPVAPDFARRQVFVPGAAETVTAGEQAEIELGVGATEAPIYPINAKTLDLTSLGSPQNTAVTAELTNGTTSVPVDEVSLVDGIATVRFEAPAAGAWTLHAVAEPTGTVVDLPVQVEPAEPVGKVASRTVARVKPARVVAKRTRARVLVQVRAGGERVDGTVLVRSAGKVRFAQVRNGKAMVRLAPFKRPGRSLVTVLYVGDQTTKASRDAVRVKVRKPARRNRR